MGGSESSKVCLRNIGMVPLEGEEKFQRRREQEKEVCSRTGYTQIVGTFFDSQILTIFFV